MQLSSIQNSGFVNALQQPKAGSEYQFQPFLQIIILTLTGDVAFAFWKSPMICHPYALVHPCVTFMIIYALDYIIDGEIL